MNQLTLRNNRLKFETLRKLPIILEESMEYIMKNGKTTRCTLVGHGNIRIGPHVFIWLSPAPPTPPSLPALAWELFYVANQYDNTQSLKPLNFFGM